MIGVLIIFAIWAGVYFVWQAPLTFVAMVLVGIPLRLWWDKRKMRTGTMP